MVVTFPQRNGEDLLIKLGDLIQQNEVTSCPSGVQVNAGETVTVPASDLGDPSNMYLNATNLSTDTEGSYRVTIV